jgi:hypothetical protein
VADLDRGYADGHSATILSGMARVTQIIVPKLDVNVDGKYLVYMGAAGPDGAQKDGLVKKPRSARRVHGGW